MHTYRAHKLLDIPIEHSHPELCLCLLHTFHAETPIVETNRLVNKQPFAVVQYDLYHRFRRKIYICSLRWQLSTYCKSRYKNLLN